MGRQATYHTKQPTPSEILIISQVAEPKLYETVKISSYHEIFYIYITKNIIIYTHNTLYNPQ